MFRIKLPGSLKVKRIILGILTIISIIIIVKTGVDNKNQADIESHEQLEETLGKQEGSYEKLEPKKENKDWEREDSLYNSCYSLFHNGMYKETVNTADDLISEFKDSYKGYCIRGIAKGYLGNFDDGMKDIDKSLEINPSYGYGRFNKALLYEVNGDYEDSLFWYDKALEIEKYMWSYYGKASIYGRRGSVNDAVKNLKLAIDSAKSNSDKVSIKENARNEKDFKPISEDNAFQDLLK